MKKLLLKNTFVIFLLFFFCFLWAENLFAQNSINGVVFDNNRKPVARIEVELLDEFERLIKSTKTTNSGLYFFQGLRAGVYYIQVRVDGTNFRSVKERLQIGQGNRTNRTTGSISGSEILQVNFNLETFRQNENQTPVINEVVFAQTIPPGAGKYFENALKKLKDNKPDEAIVELENAIKIFPEYFLALKKLGYEYLAKNKFAEAENIFAKAFEVNPKSFSAKSGAGIAQFKLGKKSEAAQTLEEAVIINPSSANSFLFLGKIYRELKEFDKAESNFKKAENLSKNKLADIHWELALLYYYNLNRFEDAADELEAFLKASPNAENKKQIEKLIKMLREKAKQKI